MSTCRILDNLPVAVVRRRLESGTVPDMRNNVKGGSPRITYDRGFPVGFKASYETVSINDMKLPFTNYPVAIKFLLLLSEMLQKLSTNLLLLCEL